MIYKPAGDRVHEGVGGARCPALAALTMRDAMHGLAGDDSRDRPIEAAVRSNTQPLLKYLRQLRLCQPTAVPGKRSCLETLKSPVRRAQVTWALWSSLQLRVAGSGQLHSHRRRPSCVVNSTSPGPMTALLPATHCCCVAGEVGA